MELLVDAVEVVLRFGDRVWRAVEVVQRVGARRLGAVQVVEREPQLLAELADLDMAGVDQLAAALDDHPGAERVAARPHATPDAIGGLQHRRVDPAWRSRYAHVRPASPAPTTTTRWEPETAARTGRAPTVAASVAAPAAPRNWRRVMAASCAMRWTASASGVRGIERH